jgi:hypothetical protein
VSLRASRFRPPHRLRPRPLSHDRHSPCSRCCESQQAKSDCTVGASVRSCDHLSTSLSLSTPARRRCVAEARILPTLRTCGTEHAVPDRLQVQIRVFRLLRCSALRYTVLPSYYRPGLPHRCIEMPSLGFARRCASS